jgi:hypothetical protein
MADLNDRAKLKLVGNSTVSPMQYDKETEAAIGFDIQNPNGTKLHVELPQYLRQSEASHSANKLRAQVYHDFKFLAENVPAATPMFESIANDYPKGIAFQRADKFGLWNESPGKNENTLDPKSAPAVITGNLRLTEGDSPLQSGGGGASTDMKAHHFLGKDGKWHVHTHEEALLHELSHSVKNLQNMLSAKEMLEENAKAGVIIPVENVKINIRQENEARAIALVNKVLASPLRRPEQAPDSYGMMRPFGTNFQSAKAYTSAEMDALKRVPIPEELSALSQPKVKEISHKTQFESTSSLTPMQKNIAVGEQLNSLTSDQQEILKKYPEHKAQIETHQQSRIIDNSNQEHIQTL